MSRGFTSTGRPPNAPLPTSPAAALGVETSVRQLIANGKSKTALERAKEHHKQQGSAESEALLIAAYAARIQSLIGSGLAVEARSLLDLVLERYPSAKARFKDLTLSAAASTGAIDELVRPLNDPALSAEQRAAVECAVQNQVHDLAALAACSALPLEHPLRQAASALHQALAAVTSGPVAEDSLALPEISRRSPLASWKLLVRAIGCFYRGDDVACREYLAAIKPDSAPARLIPAMNAMLGGATQDRLTPAAAALVVQTTANSAALRSALEALDRSFLSGNPSRVLKDIRVAVAECRESLPGGLERLKQHISVRCALAQMDKGKVTAALGGSSSHDAYFLRLFARGMEQTDDPEDLTVACGIWDEFRRAAVREGWFTANGAESATLYLHMADVLQKIPSGLLVELQRSIRAGRAAPPAEDLYFLFPQKLYERACALDPHLEAFSQWLAWAKRAPGRIAEQVAGSWHKIRPMDLEPVLFLMQQAASRNA